jgi:hypothetical protein
MPSVTQDNNSELEIGDDQPEDSVVFTLLLNIKEDLAPQQKVLHEDPLHQDKQFQSPWVPLPKQ